MKRLSLKTSLLLLLILVFSWSSNIGTSTAEGGTVYIKADGSVDPPSTPITNVGNTLYTFTGNISDSLVVERNDIVVDGAGYTLKGVGNGTGVTLNGRNNVTISNMVIINFTIGIELTDSINNTISGNNITGAAGTLNYCINVERSDNNNITGNRINGGVTGIEAPIGIRIIGDHNYVAGNDVTSCGLYGLDLSYSSFNTVVQNNISSNYYVGMSLYCSSNNLLRNNVMNDNRYNFRIENFDVIGWLYSVVNDVDSSNTVDGKPIYYWVNQADLTVPTDAGYVALINCNNIVVQNLDLKNNYNSIFLVGTSGSTIMKNNLTQFFEGIRLSTLNSNNNIAQNTIEAVLGIDLILSSNNVITKNNITKDVRGSMAGIALEFSSNNNILSGNNLVQNHHGVYIQSSTDNRLYHNNFDNNIHQATLVGSGLPNFWDNGYPSGGNYWSDFVGVDTNGDGLSETPYVIDSDNRDNYPLMSPRISVPEGRLIVRGIDNRILFGDIPDEFSQGWTALPNGYTSDSPAAAICRNELHVVVRSTDGSGIWHSYINRSDGSFSGWTLLSGYTQSAPTLTWNGTHLCLVVRGLDDRIYYRFYTLASRTWSEWTPLPSGLTGDSPAATILNGTLHIVVRGIDGSSLWHSNVDLSTGTFSGWALMDGMTQSPPTLAACSSLNQVYSVVRGLDDKIYRNTWTGSGWTGWQAIPSGYTNDGPGATVINEELYIVVQGLEGLNIWQSSTNLITGAFSGWTQINGFTPSKPTLTS